MDAWAHILLWIDTNPYKTKDLHNKAQNRQLKKIIFIYI